MTTTRTAWPARPSSWSWARGTGCRWAVVTRVTCHVSQVMLQVYLYTFTGLHDKPGNHLTQFMGVLLKPLASLPDSSVLTEKPKKRVIMSLE